MDMTDKWKLPPGKLRKAIDPQSWKFETTEELKSTASLIGQERAVESISFGLEVPSRGYNIFVTGHPGNGRTRYALERLRERAKHIPAPNDWVYVYNFDEPGEPLAIPLPAGYGKNLCTALDELINELKVTISKAFEKSQYEDAKAQFVKVFQEKAGAIMDELKTWSAEKGFALKRTPQGFVNIPLIETQDEEGKTVTREIQQEEFEALSDEKQKSYQAASEEVSQKTLLSLRRIRDMEKELKEEISKLEAEICRTAITPYLSDIREKYADVGKLDGSKPSRNGKHKSSSAGSSGSSIGSSNEILSKWFDRLTEDIIENFGAFVTSVRDDSSEVDFSRYTGNLFVGNDPDAGAPVVWETNPTYYNLAGKVEYESRQGYLYTDFRRIVAGAFHKANGGFLVLDAEKVLMNFMSWEAIKRVLRTGESNIENLGEQYGAIPVSSLRPTPIQMDLKIVMVGTPYIYELLQYYDPEFQKIFKIKASFDFDMPRNRNTEREMARFVAGVAGEEKLLPFDASAVSEILEWASRAADDQDLLSIEVGRIRELIVESHAWAKTAKTRRVGKDHVQKAIRHKKYRAGLYQDKLMRAFASGLIRVDTEGEMVGQINGLSVIDLTDHRFGHPSRITANVYMGQEGVVNIEREVKMTGPIHNKGLMILSSYLGRMYAQDMPLSLSARLTFEQNYGGVEGDSASSTELYCLLSALSKLPLKQSIAVTGSVDQFGNVQPIGGVNEKIEGFFECCKVRGLSVSGNQGVMIPKQNVKHLMLDHEVIDAVREGKFSIWAVGSIDEGIEVLTGVRAGKEKRDGTFPRDSVHGKVKARLKKLMEDSAKLRKDLSGDSEKDASSDKDAQEFRGLRSRL
ncbi:MAG: AAA family ATPase [Synergistaceae bacterium]|jgi:lon-related putative ATP-dependent protease|nr:AAA family ATPase [Synergistaceae bacterium]